MTEQPLSFYGTNKVLRFYLMDCGSGLTHLIIFPDDTVMLFDCNVLDEEKDNMLNFMRTVIPGEEGEQKIDIFVNSHRDIDHMRGLKYIHEQFPVQCVWDSGCTGASTSNDDYNYYMRLRRKCGCYVPEPSNNPFYAEEGVEIYCLSSAEDFAAAADDETALCESTDREQHTNCLVLLIVYGKRKMLLTGDSDWKAWRDKIVPAFENQNVNYENTDILIASHHGSRSFFTSENDICADDHPDTTYTESIELISPKITLISCGGYEKFNHPNKSALKLYKKYTCNEQVYTTHEHGTFCGRIDKLGNFSVTPCSFRNFGKGCALVCEVVNNNGRIIKSGSTCKIGRELRFSLIVEDEDIADINDLDVVWEVCNAGYGRDENRHDIYYKSDDDSDNKFHFVRYVSFVGIHLLRCTVTGGGFSQTIVFVVRGCK